MGRKVNVIGVFKKEGKDMLGISSDKEILMPLNFAKNVIDVQSGNYGPQIVVRGKPGISDVEVESEVRGIMRSVRRLRPGVEDNFSLNKTTLLSNQLDIVFGILNKVGGFIGIFSILVGGFGIANIMFVSVRERTSQIGLKKAIGAKRHIILTEFLLESAFLCIIGGLIGLSLVFLLTQILSGVLDFPVYISTNNMVLAIIICIIVGILAGFIPASQAARMDPVVAIRSK